MAERHRRKLPRNLATPLRPGDTPLIDAVRHGRRQEVAALLGASADVNELKTDGTGISPLFIACSKGDVGIIRLLLAAGAAVNHTDKDGVTALYIACQDGFTEAASTLLAAGAAVDQGADCMGGATPLAVACQYGHSETVSALLAAGATAEWADNDGYTPMFAACDQGHRDTVAALIEAGVPVDHCTCNGNTPLVVACYHGHRDMVSTLLAAGAAVDLAACVEGGGDFTPLLVACQNGCSEIVSTLLAAGADVNRTSIDGATPLYIACENGHADMASVLLAAGAAVDRAREDGSKPLEVACMHGQLGLVQLLSSYGADRQLSQHYTAEDLANYHGHDGLATWLVASRQWSTPLHHLEVIGAPRARALLRDGADIQAAVAPGGSTPLSLARAMHAVGGVIAGSAAQLVLDAAAPWSEANHTLFPAAARQQAVVLLRLGYLLSRQERFNRQETALYDLWRERVVPELVVR